MTTTTIMPENFYGEEPCDDDDKGFPQGKKEKEDD